MPSRRADLIALLVRAGAEGASGEVLAAALGVSRVAVAKHVAALRTAGFGIEAVRGTGYCLTSVPDAPVAVEVERLVSDPMWVRIEGTRETTSTNDDCKRLARAGAPEGTVVMAARQTGGRGRLGRSWSSPEGGVYLSALLRPRIAPADAAPLALVAALGVAMGLESIGISPTLKWPNDVLLGGGKLAGILLEMSAEADEVEWIVVGCGLNVHAPVDSLPGAAFTDDVGRRRAAEIAAAVLDGIAGAYREFSERGFAALAGRYAERHALTGQHVIVRDMTGRALASGVARGVDEGGRLLVEDAAGATVPVAAGEVTLRSPRASGPRSGARKVSGGGVPGPS